MSSIVRTRHIMGHGRGGVLRPIIPNLHLLHLYPSGPLCTLPAADASCLLWICVEDEEDARVCRWDPGSRSVRRGVVVVREGGRSFYLGEKGKCIIVIEVLLL